MKGKTMEGRIQKIALSNGKEVYVNSLDAGTELIPAEVYENLSEEDKYSYCLSVHEYYETVEGGLCHIWTGSENPLKNSLGILFGCTECMIAGEVLDYAMLRIVFMIIDVVKTGV